MFISLLVAGVALCFVLIFITGRSGPWLSWLWPMTPGITRSF